MKQGLPDRLTVALATLSGKCALLLRSGGIRTHGSPKAV